MNENNNVQNNLNIQPTPMPKPVSPTPNVTQAAPVSPTPSVTPAAPVSPAPSVTPAAPVSPAPSVTPAAPVSPTPSVTPAAPVSPAPSVTPAAPVSPTPSVTPAAPVSPTPNVTPAAPVSPAPNVTPAAPVSPTPSVTPAAPVSPTPSVENNQVAEKTYEAVKPITPNVDFSKEEFKTNDEIIEKNEQEKKEIKFVNPLNPETEINIPKKEETPEPVTQPIQEENKPEENNKKEGPNKEQNKKLLIIVALVIALLAIGIAVYFVFFKEDDKKPIEPPVNNDVTPPVVEEKVKVQTLTLKSSEDVKTADDLGTEKTNQRKNINDFSIDINYALVDAGYSFNIVDNVVTIKANDNSYEYYLVQLNNKTYKDPIPLDLKQSYEDLIQGIGNVIDINSDDKVVNFYKQNQIDQDAYFETLKLNKKLELLNKAFNTEIDTLIKNEAVCNFGDCSTIIYANDIENPTETITLITKAESDDKEKVFFGTYLVYEKTNGTIKDVVSLTDDLFLSVTEEESE